MQRTVDAIRDVLRLERRLEVHGGDVDDPALQNMNFVDSLYIGELSEEQFANVPINSLDNVLLEIAAGRHRATRDRRKPSDIVDQGSYLRGENWRAFLARISEALGPRSD